MRIITLNIWGGKSFEPLIEFIKKYSKDTGVFCFQEVFRAGKSTREVYAGARMTIFEDIQNVLTDFIGYFAPCQNDEEGLAIFIKKGIKVDDEGDVFVFRERNSRINNDARTLGRNLHYVKIRYGSKEITIANVHGLWNGQGKTDTQDRIEQSKKIKMFLDKCKGEKILCGDFNLLPETESIRIIEKDMKNLIKDFKIESTRSQSYTKPDKHADYILVSENIDVKEFKVLQEHVSDHMPLMLEFN
ncbi:MAG: endonuclease/exonuclease/phosphatase family protein [Nanoarchaeota archaeon]